MADAGAYLTREDAQAMADEGSYDTERALASVLAMHDEIDRLRDAVWTYLREAYPVGTEHPVDLDADLLRERSGISMDYWCEQCPTATESTGPTEGATVADIDATLTPRMAWLLRRIHEETKNGRAPTVADIVDDGVSDNSARYALRRAWDAGLVTEFGIEMTSRGGYGMSWGLTGEGYLALMAVTGPTEGGDLG